MYQSSHERTAIILLIRSIRFGGTRPIHNANSFLAGHFNISSYKFSVSSYLSIATSANVLRSNRKSFIQYGVLQHGKTYVL